MRIIITGGLGYIGSSLCELYRNATGNEIIVIDKRFIPEQVANFPPHFQYIEGDVADLDLMRHLLRDADILHYLAAEVEAEKSIHKERAVWENNFDIPKSIFETCPPSVRIMFPSTGNVFGGLDQSRDFMNLTEEDEPQPKYPYAETKRAVEEYLLGSDHNFVILRFGTNHGYAPGLRFNLVTNAFFKRAMIGRPLMVHGGGLNWRPTVCVRDCARALLFLSTEQAARGEIFHVVRENFQIRELAQLTAQHCNRGARIEFVAKEVPFSSYALVSDKVQELGFRFEWNLESSIKDMRRRFQAVARLPVDSAEQAV